MFVLVPLLIGAVSATTWYVDDDGGAGMDFTKIQDAVDAAQDNDTIIVYNGTYNENLTLNKQLTLKGSGMPVVDAGVSGSVITVHANGCIIDGFKINRSGYGLKDAGIKVESDKNIIKSNIISNNWYGIHLRKRVSNNTIQDNKVVSNKYIGISLDDDTSNNTVLNNTVISNEDDGIEIDESNNNTIDNNIISQNNGLGISIDDWSDDNIISNNTISENAGEGMWMGYYSSNNKIVNNKIVFNDDGGICFSGHTSCNLIANNNISFNDDDGIVLKTSQYNTIRSNTITSNDGKGIKLDSAPNNIVYHNNLIDNDPNGYDDTGANNSWDNGPIIGGNYWDDHTCDGNPSNGRQPYHIDKYGEDNYPFENPIAEAPPLPPPQPKSQIHLHKEMCLSTKDTHIDPSQIYDFTTNWSANVWEVKNLANVTYTITTTKNFIYINNWELYQNGTDNSFIFPPSIEGTTYTWVFPLKDRIGSGINFVLDSPKIVQDNPWVDMDVSTMNEDNYTRLNITFTPVISIDWVNLNILGDQIIDTTRFPSEFDLVPYTSNRIEFNSGEINQGQTYEFSILVKEPDEVNIWLDRSFGWVKNPPSDTITVPVAELGSVTVTADVPVKWEHTPALPQYVQSITINMGARHP
jgi:parallel beta-helix repeat protein